MAHDIVPESKFEGDREDEPDTADRECLLCGLQGPDMLKNRNNYSRK